MHCNESELVSLVQEQVAELGLAYPHCIRQHGLEDRLKHSWRRADDTEDFGRRRLLLKGLGQLSRARLHLLEQTRVLDGVAKVLSSSICRSVNGRTSARRIEITPIALPARIRG